MIACFFHSYRCLFSRVLYYHSFRNLLKCMGNLLEAVIARSIRIVSSIGFSIDDVRLIERFVPFNEFIPAL